MSGQELCTCGGLTNTCDGCPDCVGLGCPEPGFPRRERTCEACGAALGMMTDLAYIAMGRSCDACADRPYDVLEGR